MNVKVGSPGSTGRPVRYDRSVDTRVLLNEVFALGLQPGDLRVDVFDLLLDVVVMLLQQLACFIEVRSGRGGATQRLVGGLDRKSVV